MTSLPQQQSRRRQVQQDVGVDQTLLTKSRYFLCYWSYIGLEATPARSVHKNMDLFTSLDSWEDDNDESEEEEEQIECMMRHFQLVYTELMASYDSDKRTTTCQSNKRK